MKYFSGFLFGVLVVLTGCSNSPESTLNDYNGQPLSVTAQDSSWLVVNYWATWCDPCRDEIPELNALAEAGNGIRVWGVDFDEPESKDDLAGKVEKLGITFPVVEPASVSLLGLEKPPVLPATYIFNSQGEEVKQLLGPQTKDSLTEVIDQLKNS